MLPNFRRSEPETAKPQINFSSADSASVFPVRNISTAPRANERVAASVIGPDLTINGNLISKGEVQVDGIVEGDIHGSHVIIGETATISGGIVADEVVIRGHVVGSVRSKRVMLQSTSQVEGDIFHQSLSIEQGAMFEGKSRRTTDDPRTIPLASAPAPTPMPAPTPVFAMPPRIPELPN
jgi:cytoskeletal protein CcmA (bactofilin family)